MSWHMQRRMMGGGSLGFEALLLSYPGTLIHYWPTTDASIVENGPPYLVDNTGNSTNSDGGVWANTAYTNIEQSSPGAGYSAESSCFKVGMTTGSPAPLSAEVCDFLPTAYNPGSGSDDENSAGMWIKQVSPRAENDFNYFLIRAFGLASPGHNTSYRINHATNEVHLQHGGGTTSNFAFTRGSDWNLIGFTESYATGANTTTFKLYQNGVLINTNVIAGDVGGLHWLGSGRVLSCTFESAANQTIATSYHLQGASFIQRNHAITEAQWLQLYNAGS